MGFWSRNTVADRMDDAIAVLAAQLEKGLSEVRADVQQIGQRCDAVRADVQGVADQCNRIMASTEAVPGMAAAIPGIVSVTDMLVDIGMAHVHQTATFQHALAREAAVHPILAHAEHADHAEIAEPADEAETSDGPEASRLAPTERQIFDNFTRAFQTFVG